MSVALRMSHVSKSFGAVQALDDVSLKVEQGAIHALVGENGAGKTTLMRILFGALRSDSGEIELERSTKSFNSSSDAAAAGIGMVSQHYGIVPALTCLENLVLGAEQGALLSRGRLTGRAQQLAARMDFKFDWQAEASTLSPAGAQKLEILKLLWRESRIMILDEPTAMLSPSDAESLFESLRELTAAGATVILVTHRLPEVKAHCSRVTVLRGGKRVAERVVADTSVPELARLVVGENSPALAEELSTPHVSTVSPSSREVLGLNGVTVLDARGHEALKDADLIVNEGEIVGVAGVDGNGQRELVQSILGSLRLAAGQVRFDGRDARDVPSSSRLQQGLRLIPEDRQVEGAIEGWSIEYNSALGLQRLPPISSSGLIDSKALRTFAKRVADRFTTKHGGLGLPMASLSGGNQQRVVASRALELSPRLLLAFQPVRGLDLGGAAGVYGAIRQKCAQGMAALVISFDLDELLAHCDRIVVLHRGQLAEPAPGDEHDREAIGRLMVGAA